MCTLTLKRLGIISLIVLLVVAAVVFLVDINKRVEMKRIMDQRDTRLDAYDYAKTLAAGVPEIITVNSQSSYNYLRDKYRKIMIEELWDEYFSYEEYLGGEKPFNITTRSVTGEILDDGGYIFKLDLEVRIGEVTSSRVLLVTVRNDRVYKIESLG